MQTESLTETRRLSLTEAAGRLGIAMRTLELWRQRGIVRVVRVGPRRVFVDESEIQRLLNGGTDAA